MELPKVFQNNNIKIKINEQETYKNNNKNENKQPIDINTKINKLLSSNRFVYKIKAKITLKDKEIEKIIIGKYKNNLITFDNELIPIEEIIDIKEK